MSKLIDIADQKFGTLTAIKKMDFSKNRNAMWLCRCECGNEIIVSGSTLRKGQKKSCDSIKCKRKVRAKPAVHNAPVQGSGYCAYCGEVTNTVYQKYCSRACAARGVHGVEQIDVDMNYDWQEIGGGLWNCRYRRNIQCKDRNCAKCGWNPEVAEARSKAIMEQRKVEVL